MSATLIFACASATAGASTAAMTRAALAAWADHFLMWTPPDNSRGLRLCVGRYALETTAGVARIIQSVAAGGQRDSVGVTGRRLGLTRLPGPYKTMCRPQRRDLRSGEGQGRGLALKHQGPPLRGRP